MRLNPVVAAVLDKHPAARRVTIVPPVCNGLVCFSNWNSLPARTVGRTLYVNQARIPFLITEAELARMARETADWAPQFLDVDPVQGAWFALYCERQGLSFPSLQFILCSYEFVSMVHRRILERVFRVPVFNLYGSTETGHLFMENEAGGMIPCPEAVYYEVIDVDDRGIGELVVTTLTNDIMPLLRYRLGDWVAEAGRLDGTEYLVHGRVRDGDHLGGGPMFCRRRRRGALSDASNRGWPVGVPIHTGRFRACAGGLGVVAGPAGSLVTTGSRYELGAGGAAAAHAFGQISADLPRLNREHR